jgi:hypothetical protein
MRAKTLSETMPPASESAVRWIREWKGDGLADFRIGRDGEDLVAEWVGTGVLRAKRSGGRSQFTPAPGVDAARVEKFHRGLVRALLRHLEGNITLHASAVAMHGVAVAFAGVSGSGKSTTAADLCAHGEREDEIEMLADDTVAIELVPPSRREATVREGSRYAVLPTESSHWLLPDAARALGIEGGPLHFKTEIQASRLAQRPVPLVAVLTLAFDPSLSRPVLRRVHGKEAFRALNLSLFRFLIDEDVATLRDFEQLSSFCNAVPVYSLVRRPLLADLVACRDLVRGLVASLGGAP